ncbi:hypothetical protein BCR37DRAFT_383906 [Protomyces lactucae-debilis]|uniref:Uncharacterized protein n=1 Tax=Protomyces lactucae-debilis TaxID=2754530 RepID=A0A1Y2EWY9_PROLT|nr:uncharacterized protein BCR37DRAFT_383906 [Protomyces lactucae-debilis]ORY75774.1 hypothetical protein BCR37DRAFT_383906 [Protomyces lactucae-debilis]
MKSLASPTFVAAAAKSISTILYRLAIGQLLLTVHVGIVATLQAMLTSTGCLSRFIVCMVLQLSFLSSMYRGLFAEVDAADCEQHQVCATLEVKFQRPPPKCDPNTGVPEPEMCFDADALWSYLDDLKGKTDVEVERPDLLPECESDTGSSSPGTCSPPSRNFFEERYRAAADIAGARTQRPLVDCDQVCADRTADLIYSIARSKSDSCIHIMNTKDSSAWDVLFRHPWNPLSTADAEGHLCVCKIEMVLQRVITGHPLQSDSASTSSGTSWPSASVFDYGYCKVPRVTDRVLNPDKVLQQQSWYPQVSYTAESPDDILKGKGWIASRVLPRFIHGLDCDAEFQDIFADKKTNKQPDGLRPPHSSKCTIKYHSGGESHSSYTVLCCEGAFMAPIMKRIEVLHSNDLGGRSFSKADKQVCMEIGTSDVTGDMIMEKSDSKSQLQKLLPMGFM